MWYQIKACSNETLYGWTTTPAVVQAAVGHLNAKRDINVYAAEPLDLVEHGRRIWGQRAGIDDVEPSAAELTALADKALADHRGLLFTDDSTVEDFAAMHGTFDVFRAENRAGGSTDHVGNVTADNADDAQAEADATFECDRVHNLYVRPVDQ